MASEQPAPTDLTSKRPRDSPTAPKLHKSCQYCQYRKIKCVKLDGQESCQHCLSCGVPCKFSIKERSQKRRLKSARIAAALNETTTPTDTSEGAAVDEENRNASRSIGLHSFLAESASLPTPPTYQALGPGAGSPPGSTFSPGSGSFGVSPNDTRSSLEDYNANESPREQGDFPAMSMTNPSASPLPNKRTTKDIYSQFVQAFTPFLPEDLSLEDETKIGKLSKCCVSLSALTSADYMTPDATTELILEVCNQLLEQETKWEPNTIASVFLLACRSKLPDGVLGRCMQAFNEKSLPIAGRLDSKIILGAVAVETWNAAVDKRKPNINPTVLNNFDLHLREVDDNTFAYYFLTLTQTLLRVLFTFDEPTAPTPNSDNFYSWCQQRYRILQLENELLTWPVKLPKHLTVVKDELIAPNEAVILHVLHNTATLILYDYGLRHQSKYGRQMCILPVPGLLQFITGMAKSTFKCGGHMWHRWPLLRQCQSFTAQSMLDLYESTDYEFCKRALAWWCDSDIDPELFQKVKQLLGDADWTEHSDGAVVFWVYRDVRTMSLDMLLADARDRGEL